MKKPKSMLLCGGGGESLNSLSRVLAPNMNEGRRLSRKSIVISRKFINKKILARSAQNELTTNDYLLTTKALGFTMAEILLSLTIIGVVAAITLPSLTGNINERTWNTQRKALYARMSQAISLMPSLNGYGSTEENAAETFITNGLSKVLKINNVCNVDSLEDCGIPNKFLALATASPVNLDDIKTLENYYSLTDNAGNSISYPLPNTTPAAFETANGESVLLYYNPRCGNNLLKQYQLGSGSVNITSMMCANFVYDLNGKKGPNTVGKDVGVISVLYSSDSQVVAPIPDNVDGTGTYDYARQQCKLRDDNLRLPNVEELMSMFYNKKLFSFTATDSHYWTSTAVAAGKNWGITYTGRTVHPYSVELPNHFRCVKR